MGNLCNRICHIDLRLYKEISAFIVPFALACVATVMYENDGFSGQLPKLFTRLIALLVVLAGYVLCVFTRNVLYPHCDGIPLIAWTGNYVYDVTYTMIKGSYEILSVIAAPITSNYRYGSRMVYGSSIVVSVLIFLLSLTIELQPFKITKSIPLSEIPGMYKMKNFLKFLLCSK